MDNGFSGINRVAQQKFFPDRIILCLDVHLVPSIVGYQRALFTQAALIDINIEDILLVCEGSDQFVTGCDIFVGDRVALVRFFLCHKEISLNKNQCFWLEFADIIDHLLVALKKTFRGSRTALVDADHQINFGKLCLCQNIMYRHFFIIVCNLGLVVIVDRE